MILDIIFWLFIAGVVTAVVVSDIRDLPHQRERKRFFTEFDREYRKDRP